MKKVVGKLKERDGAAMMEVVVGVLIACLVAVIFINAVTALIYYSRLGTFADGVSKIVSVEGKYDNAVQETIADYKEESGLDNVTISLDGTRYISGTSKIQLNSQIAVSVSAKCKINCFSFAGFDITMTNKSLARSEVYWKN